MQVTPESLLIFIDILSEEPSFDHLVREMRGKNCMHYYNEPVAQSKIILDATKYYNNSDSGNQDTMYV
jgi:hypothetical protein